MQPHSIIRQPDYNQALALLTEAALPTSDLTPAHLEHFYSYSVNGELHGVIGIEPFAGVALLRSLAVHPAYRSSGIGKRLVEHVELQCQSSAITTLYLLTTTAEQFFVNLGYSRVPRESAPEAIQNSAEFSSICPASSAFMCKKLRHDC
jgi:amino-acid N-acetyltransferase